MSHLFLFAPRLQNEEIEARVAALPARQQVALARLTNGEGIVKIAKSLDVDRRTVYRWTLGAEFRDLRGELSRRAMQKHLKGTMFDSTRGVS